MVSRETALKQSMAIQEAVVAYLQALWKRGGTWGLMGGETVDDGKTLRVTLVLETRYATDDTREALLEPAPPRQGALVESEVAG